MDALVVFESMFGNTQTIAEAIAQGMASSDVRVEVVEVGAAPSFVDSHIGLLVVGGPTHAFGLTRPSTRAEAGKAASGPLVSAKLGLREWIAALVGGPPGLPVACFDTRIKRPRLPGSAARAAARRLRRVGFRPIVRPQSFWVTDTQGPLADGEVERARRWGELLVASSDWVVRTGSRSHRH